MTDPLFFGLLWAIFVVIGVIIGWSLRAAFPERELARTLERTEHERNTLARLYTHLKHQHELREADFKRTTLELDTLRIRAQEMEEEQSMRASIDQSSLIQVQKAEAKARHYAERIASYELISRDLQQRNADLTAELTKLQDELETWQTLYQDFQSMQQKMMRFEQHALSLETERSKLQEELNAARIEIENLQLELIHYRSQPAQKHSAAQADRTGGPAAPENADDLKLINGITPFAEMQLHTLGILTFLQISRWDDDAVIAFAKALGMSPGRIFQEDWVGQAQHLLGGGRLS